jgi:hypothetical protein
MEILSYIFFLGIIYIVFSIIWFFIALLPKYAFGNKENNLQNTILNYTIKAVQFYFLASLTAIKALEFIDEQTDPNQRPLYIVIGGIVLYLYLAGKIERSKMMSQLRSNLGNSNSSIASKYEPHLIGLTLISYAISFSYPQLIQNSVNQWFLVSIDDFYNTVIIGWIIGIIGFFFLISMVLKGVNATGFLFQTILALLTGKPAPKRKPNNPFGKFGNMGNNNPFSGNSPFGNMGNSLPEVESEEADIDDDMYVDFEVMDEEEDETDKNEE